MDDRRSQEGRKQVDEAFDEIMRRIREQNEREKFTEPDGLNRTWLTKMATRNGCEGFVSYDPIVRTILVNIISSGLKASSDDEWTEEELQELLRHELVCQRRRTGTKKKLPRK